MYVYIRVNPSYQHADPYTLKKSQIGFLVRKALKIRNELSTKTN